VKAKCSPGILENHTPSDAGHHRPEHWNAQIHHCESSETAVSILGAQCGCWTCQFTIPSHSLRGCVLAESSRDSGIYMKECGTDKKKLLYF
jgi:hypothetical protein